MNDLSRLTRPAVLIAAALALHGAAVAQSCIPVDRPVTDDEIKRYYNDPTNQNWHFRGGEQLRVRQIVVREAGKAKQVEDALRGGKAFEELARTMSDDLGGRARAGDLGWSFLDEFEPAMRSAIGALKVGETGAKPTSGAAGFAFYKLVEKRQRAPVMLEEAKPEIVALIQRDRAACAAKKGKS
jgi:peptidyl-prolyl cis-trans isomerase C